jgi:hypothetical protein
MATLTEIPNCTLEEAALMLEELKELYDTALPGVQTAVRDTLLDLELGERYDETYASRFGCGTFTKL